jgi:FkbM family methyltransferase
MTDNANVIHEQAPTAHGLGVARATRTLIRRSQLVRAVVKSEPIQHQIRTWRALTILRGRPRFLVRQFWSRGVGQYELRDSGLKFNVRHRTGDVAIVNKILARDRSVNSYVPPPQVASRLNTACSPRIFDVGANIGLFGVFALDRWPSARITSFEPDPDNVRVLRRTAAANDLGDRWRVVDRAVSNASGELSLVSNLRAETHIARAHEIGTITVPTVDFFDWQSEGVDLVKMDIEGGEWAILSDPRLSTVNAFAVRLEWHTLLCPAQDPCEEATRLLRAGGFARVLDVSHEHHRNGVLWAWRESM